MRKEVKADRDEVDKVGDAIMALSESPLEQMDREILLYLVGRLDGLLMRLDQAGSTSGRKSG